MRSKYLVSLTLIGLMLIISLYIGGSYAYYQITRNQTGVNEVASGCFDITFTDENSINLTNAYPMTDTQGLNQIPYTFTITNSCSIAANYTVTINILDVIDNIADSYIKIAINRTTATQSIKYLTDLSINTDTEVLGITNLKQSYIIESGILNAEESITFDSYIWIDENADNSLQNKNMEAAIVIINAANVEREGKYLADAIIGQYGGRLSITGPEDDLFTTISKNVENGMYAMEDDYGISYVLRGAKNYLNNNVIFAEMQWKIVRVNGDGSIRLIYNGECPNNNCSINSTGTSTQLVSLSAFNSDYNDNRYVGYMYGIETTDYNTTHTNTTSSTIKTALDEWYVNKIEGKEYESYISDTLFCNDRNISSESEYPTSNYTNLGYDTNATYYDSAMRYEKNYAGDMTFTPVLTCTLQNDRFTVDDSEIGNASLQYPVGLITFDEVWIAGSVGGVSNSTFYLYTKQVYWTLSSSHYYNSGSIVWRVAASGALNHGSYVYDSWGVRPVINLSSESMVTGSGSTTNPYVVL